MAALAERAAAAGDWLQLVKGWVPAALAPHVTSAVERGQVLTVYVASAAWAARLRFETAALLGQAREKSGAIATVQVKVMPPTRADPR
ncbi:MAG: DciA family protein [Steroidobacteraceae bacterium]